VCGLKELAHVLRAQSFFVSLSKVLLMKNKYLLSCAVLFFICTSAYAGNSTTKLIFPPLQMVEDLEAFRLQEMNRIRAEELERQRQLQLEQRRIEIAQKTKQLGIESRNCMRISCLVILRNQIQMPPK